MINRLNNILLDIGKRENRNKALHTEFSIISYYVNMLKWVNLSREQKQKKRKRILGVIKKYKEEDGLEVFSYENGLVELYDFFLLFQKKIINVTDEDLLIFRFRTLVTLDMDSIDKEAPLKRKKLIPLYVYENLKEEAERENIKIPYFEEILNSLKKVHDNMPDVQT